MINDKRYKVKLLSSLEKVFTDEEPKFRPECTKLTGLWGDTVSFQVAYTRHAYNDAELDLKIESDLADYIRVRTIEYVPVNRTVCTSGDGRVLDDNFIKTTAGMYPDLLKDLVDNKVHF